MKLLHVISLMICLSILVVIPVCAYETLQDDITAFSGMTSSGYTLVPVGGDTGKLYCVTQISVKNIENTVGTSALIHFDIDVTHLSEYAAGAPSSAQTSFTLKDGATTIGTGLIGYQRQYDLFGTELAGYQYLTFISWDVTGLSGNKVLALSFDRTVVPLAGMKYGQWAAYTPTPPTGYISWSDTVEGIGAHAGMLTTYNKQTGFTNSYSVTKGLGLGIVGTVWKQSLAGGDFYNSRAFVINATSLTTITSDSSLNDDAFHFEVVDQSIIIALYDADGTWYNTSALFSVPVAQPGSYSIVVNPSSITLPGGSATGNIIASSADLAKITDVDWWWEDATGSYDFYEAGNVSRPLSYTKIGSVWYGYQRGPGGVAGEYAINKGTGLPSPVILSNTSSSGLKLVTCFIGTSDGFWYTLTDDLTVEQGGMQTLIIEATDASSNALVGYTDISVLDKSSNLWSNITASGGVYNFLFPYNANLYVEGVATGYQRTTKNWTVLPYPSYILKLPMFPTGSVAATNVTLNVVVLDGATSGVFQNANVRLNDGQVKTTTGAGVASFTVLAGTSYQIIASYTGYNSATRTLTTGSGSTAQDTYLTLNRIVVTTAPTLPPGVTAQVTLDTRTSSQKDQDMMDLIRDSGPSLITLAIIMTMLYLVGWKP